MITDPGAARDLTDSLAEGLRLHVAEVGRRVPGATVVGQLDEPAINGVLLGRVPTPSGYGTVRSVGPAVVRAALTQVLDAIPAGGRVVHCATRTPVGLLREAGVDAISLDLRRLARPTTTPWGRRSTRDCRCGWESCRPWTDPSTPPRPGTRS